MFAPMQFIFSARVRNTYYPLDLSPTLRIPIAVTLAVAVLNVVLAAIGDFGWDSASALISSALLRST